MKYFMEYLVKQKDDSPLYLFESALEDRDEGSKIIKRFQVPKYFRDDLF
jgi:histone arginine demethylase JMJD6